MQIVYSKKELRLLTQEDRNLLESEFSKIEQQCLNILKDREIESMARTKPLIDPTKLTSNGKVVNRKYNINFDYFDTVTLENSYWAGFIAGDGHISKDSNLVAITLNGKDHNHLEEFKKAVQYEGPIRYYEILTPLGNPTTQSRFASNVASWKTDLYKNFNIACGNKTNNLEPPNNLTLNESLAYLKGLIDADGHIKIGPKSKKLEIVGTHSLMNWCNDLINSVTADLKRNDSVNVRVASNSKVVSRYQLRGPQFLKLASIIVDLNLPGLDRKWKPIQVALLSD